MSVTGRWLSAILAGCLAAIALSAPAAAQTNNPRVGIDIDSQLVTPDLVDYLSQFGFGYLRMKLAAEDLTDETGENLRLLASVKSRCDARGMKLWLVLDSRTYDAEIMKSACEKLRTIPGDLPWAVQILNDVNVSVGLGIARYASIVRIADLALSLPEGHYLLLGGIKGPDLNFLGKLKEAGALDRVDAVTLNLFPPADGIETDTKTKIKPPSDILTAAAFIKGAASMGKDVWLGELGVANSITGFGVDTFTQAGDLPRAALLLISQGASCVTMFTALDPPYENQSGIVLQFGMIPADLHPRPWGWAMRNMNLLLGDMYPTWYDQPITFAPAFPATSDTIYHVFYENERYFAIVLWTPTISSLYRKTGLMLYDTSIKAVGFQNLLDENFIHAESKAAKNVVLIPDITLSSIPTVLVFEKLLASPAEQSTSGS